MATSKEKNNANPKKTIKPQKVIPASQIKKTYLTASQLENFRDALISLKHKILKDINEMEDMSLNSHKDSTGDLSGYSLHMADMGTDNYDRELALDVVGNEQDMLYNIDKALNRIEEGVYGICEITGEHIPIPRLKAIPWTPYCKEAAEKLEKNRI